jgi:hypothetical protein
LAAGDKEGLARLDAAQKRQKAAPVLRGDAETWCFTVFTCFFVGR